jgi:hypothetical protein
MQPQPSGTSTKKQIWILVVKWVKKAPVEDKTLSMTNHLMELKLMKMLTQKNT